jgi:hypothetical protein
LVRSTPDLNFSSAKFLTLKHNEKTTGDREVLKTVRWRLAAASTLMLTTMANVAYSQQTTDQPQKPIAQQLVRSLLSQPERRD